jgi:hypothetical protein
LGAAGSLGIDPVARRRGRAGSRAQDEMAGLAQIKRDWALPIRVVAVLMMLWARTEAANVSGVAHP